MKWAPCNSIIGGLTCRKLERYMRQPRLDGEVQRLRQEIDRLNGVIQGMETEVNRQSQKAAEADSLKGQLASLRGQHLALTSQNQDLIQQNRDLLRFKEESGLNNSNLIRLQDALRQEQIRALNAEAKAQELETEKAILRNKVSAQGLLANEREGERQRHYQELSVEAQKMQKKMLDLKDAQIEELGRQVDFFKNQSEGNRGEIDKARRGQDARMREMEEEMNGLRRDNQALKEEISRLAEVIEDKDAMLRKIGNLDLRESHHDVMGPEGLVSELPPIHGEEDQLEKVYNQMLDREEQGGEYQYMQSFQPGEEDEDEEQYRAKMTLLSHKQKNMGLSSRPKTLMSEVDVNNFPKVNAKMEESELRDGSYVRDIKDSNHLLRSQLAKLASELEELREENQRLKKLARDLEEQAGLADGWKSKLHGVREEVRELEESLGKSRRRAGQDKGDFEDQIERLAEKLSREKGKNRDLEEQLRQYQKELQGSQNGLKDMLRNLGNHEGPNGLNTELLREIIRKVEDLHSTCRI